MEERDHTLKMTEHIRSAIFKCIKRVSQTVSSTKVYFATIQFFAGTSILLGTILSAISFHGLAKGKGLPLTFGSETISLDPLLAGFLFEVAGILLTFEGIMIIKTIFKISQLNVTSIFLGFCCLNIPAIFIGFGYTLAAGVSAVVFGFLWLITVLAWLQRGE